MISHRLRAAALGIGILVAAERTNAQPPPQQPATEGAPRAEPGQVIVTPPPPSDGALQNDAPAPPPPLPAGASPTSAAPAPPSEKKPVAGYIPGSGFVIQSEDAAYKLRVGLQAAYKFEPVYRDGTHQNRNTFFVLRPILSGNFFREWIHFWTSMELAANPPYALDSYVEIFPLKEFGLRIGQQFTPYDRHEYFGAQEILFPAWAPVSEYFWTGRDKGVTAMGKFGEELEYWAGVYSGTPLRQYNALAGNYVFIGRLTWNPLGPVGATEFPYIVSDGPTPFRVSATVQGYYGKVQRAAENFNPATFRFDVVATGETQKQEAGGADLWVQGGRFFFYADGTIRRTTPPMGAAAYTSIGVWGQLGMMLIDKAVDAGVRFNWLNPSIDLPSDQFYSIEGQLAYYISQSPGLVLKLRYGLGKQGSPGTDALGPVPLVISSPGTTQLGTIQLNVAF
jgi:hypothetical protein